LCLLGLLVCYVVWSTALATFSFFTLSLHDALPICTGPDLGSRQRPTNFPHGFQPGRDRRGAARRAPRWRVQTASAPRAPAAPSADRKSTRLNSSHVKISYAVFCLKKKK